MEKLTCKNCGAPLDKNGKCSYCGTIYKIEYDPVLPARIIELHSAPVKTLACQATIPRFIVDKMDPEAARDYTLEELRNKMADGLLGMMEIHSEVEPYSDVMVVRGYVRVVPPEFRF